MEGGKKEESGRVSEVGWRRDGGGGGEAAESGTC